MKILFVCRGNVGRSQMAAGLFKKIYPEHEVVSAGTTVMSSEGIDRHGQRLDSIEGSVKVIEVLKEMGIDISDKTMTRISEVDLKDNYDKIIVMAEPENIPEWLSSHPNYVYWEVEDPKGTDLDFHRKTRDRIKELITKNKEIFIFPNLAFVDGQNLHFGTTKCYKCSEKFHIELKNMKLSDCKCGLAWKVNLSKFRIYLKDKYNISEAYYFLGYLNEDNEELYKEIQKAGFIVIFKEHHRLAKSTKRGNIDADLIFEVMKNLLDNNKFNQVVIVSGDGDYIKLINYLILKNKFKKILFPNKKFASSLYKKFGSEMYDYLDNIKKYITS